MAQNKEMLGTAPIGTLVLTLAVPAVAAQIVNMLYNIVDRIYIGHIPEVGADALTGVGVTFPIILLISAFASLAGLGGAPLAAIQMGAGNRGEAERILGNAVTMLLTMTVILTTVFMVFKVPMLHAFGASDNIIGYGDDYLSIYLWGTVFVQLVMGLNPFITAQGKAKIAMYSVLIGAGLNIILDPIFIFMLGMGVKGAATATVISQAVSAIWVVQFLLGEDSLLRIRRANMSADWKLVGKIAGLGIAPFIMQSTESLVSITLNSGLQTFGGDLYVGGMTILQSMMQMIVMPINGISQGVQPIIAYNYGAGNYRRVRETFALMLKITLTGTTVASLTVIMFPRVIARLFTDDLALIEIVGETAPIFFAGIWIFGAQMACQSTFMGLGQAKISLFLALLRKVILLVPLAYILPRTTGDVMSIFMAEPIADIIASCTTLTIFLILKKKLLPLEDGTPNRISHRK